MEIFKIFCKDEMSKTGVTSLNVAGQSKEQVIRWWNESGKGNILPLSAIQGVRGDINEWESYA